MLGNRNFGFSGGGGTGGGGGTIGGGGTLNYVAMFSPDGTNIANAPIKIGDTVTRSYPANTGQDSVAIGYDTTLVGSDNYSVGYNINHNGSGGNFIVGHDVNIDNSSGNLFSFGSIFNITGGAFIDAIINLSLASTITATSTTRGVFLFGDSHICNDFVTYSTLIGESCNFTRVDHCTALGIFTNLTDTVNVYSFGESNTIDSSNTITNFGTGNTINGSINLGVFGNGNTITDSNQLYLGNNNLNLTIDSLTGRVIALYPTSLDPLVWGHTFASPSGSAKAFSVGTSGLTQSLFDIYNNGAFEIGHLASSVSKFGGDGINKFYFTGDVSQSVGVNIAAPTATIHAIGEDNTLANYTFKAQNSVADDLFNIKNDGSVGVGVLASVGKFHAFGMLSDINQRLEPVAGVTEDISGATTTTSGAVTVTLQTIAIPTDTIYMIEARITCKKTAGVGAGTIGQGNGYIRVACYQNIGGVVTISGVVQSSFTGESIAPLNATLTISGTNVLVRVSGSVNNDVTWNTITRIEKVG